MPKGAYIAPKITRFVIPYAICKRVAEELFFEEFELLVYLKSISNGCLLVDKKIVSSAANFLGCHPKTVKRRLKRLEERNWVGCWKGSGKHIFRAWKELFVVEGIAPFRRGVVFETKHFPNFKAFIVSALIGALAKSQAITEQKMRRAGAPNSAPHQPGVSSKKLFPVACQYIASVFKVALSTASEWKTLGQKAGFLKVEKQLEPFLFVNAKEYKRHKQPGAECLVYRDGAYYFQGIDLITPMLKYRTISPFSWDQKRRGGRGQKPKHIKLDKKLGSSILSIIHFEQEMSRTHNK